MRKKTYRQEERKRALLTIWARPTAHILLGQLMARQSEARQVRSWLLALCMPLFILTPNTDTIIHLLTLI